MNENKPLSPSKIVQTMMDEDAFSQWLGIEILEIKEGYAKLKLVVRPEMVNGFGIAHGGIAYSLADSALAFASNTLGQIAVSTHTSISYFAKVKPGDELIAVAKSLSQGNKIAHYQIEIKNQLNEPVASFNGAVYRTPKLWLDNED